MSAALESCVLTRYLVGSACQKRRPRIFSNTAHTTIELRYDEHSVILNTRRWIRIFTLLQEIVQNLNQIIEVSRNYRTERAQNGEGTERAQEESDMKMILHTVCLGVGHSG